VRNIYDVRRATSRGVNATVQIGITRATAALTVTLEGREPRAQPSVAGLPNQTILQTGPNVTRRGRKPKPSTAGYETQLRLWVEDTGHPAIRRVESHHFQWKGPLEWYRNQRLACVRRPLRRGAV